MTGPDLFLAVIIIAAGVCLAAEVRRRAPFRRD